MEYEDVVNKLIGEIDPVGETHTDNARYKNLSEMTALIDRLMYEMHKIAKYDRPEYSINRAAKHCRHFLQYTREEIASTLGEASNDK